MIACGLIILDTLVLSQVEGLGFHLGLRPGGLRLTGKGEPPPDVLALICEHRAGLVDLLEADAQAWAHSRQA